MIRVMLRRSWLATAPLWLMGSGLLVWAALHWGWWEWLRVIALFVAAIVGVIAALSFWHGLAFFTRNGFWLPGLGGGRWNDVIESADLVVTMRRSDPSGFHRKVSFGRVAAWPATQRWLDTKLPTDLPRLDRAEPDPDFVTSVDIWVEKLLSELRTRANLPGYVRQWILPSSDLPQHCVRIAFEPTASGSIIEVYVHDYDEPAIVKVDGCFDLADWSADDDSNYEDPAALAHRSLERTVNVVLSLLSDTPREPLPAWQISDASGELRQFYPVRLSPLRLIRGDLAGPVVLAD